MGGQNAPLELVDGAKTRCGWQRCRPTARPAATSTWARRCPGSCENRPGCESSRMSRIKACAARARTARPWRTSNWCRRRGTGAAAGPRGHPEIPGGIYSSIQMSASEPARHCRRTHRFSNAAILTYDAHFRAAQEGLARLVEEFHTSVPSDRDARSLRRGLLPERRRPRGGLRLFRGLRRRGRRAPLRKGQGERRSPPSRSSASIFSGPPSRGRRAGSIRRFRETFLRPSRCSRPCR